MSESKYSLIHVVCHIYLPLHLAHMVGLHFLAFSASIEIIICFFIFQFVNMVYYID